MGMAAGRCDGGHGGAPERHQLAMGAAGNCGGGGILYLYGCPSALEGAAALLPKALAVPVLLWTVFAMAWTANLSVLAFPMHDGFPGLGWIVLALAAWGSRKGAAACAACAGVLCLFLLVLYGTVVVFAVPDVK